MAFQRKQPTRAPGSTQSIVRPGRQGRVVKKKLGTTPRIQKEKHKERSRILKEKKDADGRAAMNADDLCEKAIKASPSPAPVGPAQDNGGSALRLL